MTPSVPEFKCAQTKLNHGETTGQEIEHIFGKYIWLKEEVGNSWDNIKAISGHKYHQNHPNSRIKQ